jgi:hypothetical protein
LPFTEPNEWHVLHPALVHTAAPAEVSPVGRGVDGGAGAGAGGGAVVVPGLVVVFGGVAGVAGGVAARGRVTPDPIGPVIAIVASAATDERLE